MCEMLELLAEMRAIVDKVNNDGMDSAMLAFAALLARRFADKAESEA